MDISEWDTQRMAAVPTRPQHWPPQPPRPGPNAAAITAACLAGLAVVALNLGAHVLPALLGLAAVGTAIGGHQVSRRTGRGMRLSLLALVVGLLAVLAAIGS